MIKAILETKGGGKMLVIGLSKMNCEKILAGQPIHFTNSALPMEGINQVLVMGGETEEAIGEELAKALDGVPRKTETPS